MAKLQRLSDGGERHALQSKKVFLDAYLHYAYAQKYVLLDILLFPFLGLIVITLKNESMTIEVPW